MASVAEPGEDQRPPTDPDEKRIFELLADLPDPEIPVLTLMDLGIIRSAKVDGDAVTVAVAPTYSGCPATEVIEGSVRERLEKAGYRATVVKALSPPWSSDWISAGGREKLRQYGITPPAETSSSKRSILGGPQPVIACPRCDSANTTRVSEFGSTPCKASYKCAECLEPFEYFKCI